MAFEDDEGVCLDVTTIPGLRLPQNINDVGECYQRVMPDFCETANGGARCLKGVVGSEVEHKGWRAVRWKPSIWATLSRPMAQAMIDHFNQVCENLRITHAVLLLLQLAENGIPEWVDPEEYGNAGNELGESYSTYRTWKRYPEAGEWLLTGATSTTLTFTFTVSDDPRNLEDNMGSWFTMLDWGIANLGSNSPLSETAEFIIAPQFIISDIVAGLGTCTITSKTPVPDNVLNKLNPALPLTITVKFLVGGGRPLWPWPRNIRARWGTRADLSVEAEPNDETALPIYPDRCMHSIDNPTNESQTGGIGLADPAATGLDIYLKWFCEDWNSLNATEKAGYVAKCNQTTCRFFNRGGWPPDSPIQIGKGDVLDECLGKIIYMRQWMVEQASLDLSDTDPATFPDHFYLRNVGHPSLFSLTMSQWTMAAAGGRWFHTEWFKSDGGGGYGRIVTYPELTNGKWTDLWSGLELIDGKNETGPGANKGIEPIPAAQINWNNLEANDVNDPDKQVRAGVGEGFHAVERHGGKNSPHEGRVHGRAAWCVRYVPTWVLFPNINPALTGWQEYEDGRAKVIMRKADMTITTNEGEAYYRLDVQLSIGYDDEGQVNCGIDFLKRKSFADLPAITTVTVFQSFTSGVPADHLGLALAHKERAIGKKVDSFTEDEVISVKRGGSNGLPDNARREWNWASPMAQVGAGAGGEWLRAGMAIRVPSTEAIPERLRGLILPIVRFKAMDVATNLWEKSGDMSNCQGLFQTWLPAPNLQDYDYCDTIRVYDPKAVLAEVGALTGMVFDVVLCAKAAPNPAPDPNYDAWWSSGPNVNPEPSPLAGVYAHDTSAVYHVPGPLPFCLVGRVKKATFDPFYSYKNDLLTVGATVRRLLEE